MHNLDNYEIVLYECHRVEWVLVRLFIKLLSNIWS